MVGLCARRAQADVVGPFCGLELERAAQCGEFAFAGVAVGTVDLPRRCLGNQQLVGVVLVLQLARDSRDGAVFRRSRHLVGLAVDDFIRCCFQLGQLLTVLFQELGILRPQRTARRGARSAHRPNTLVAAYRCQILHLIHLGISRQDCIHPVSRIDR